MEKSSFMAHVSGNVQGVGFRYFTYKRAKSYNLTGYVKNLANGNVEVFAEGERGDLEKLLLDLQNGPNFAYVQDVKVDWKEYQNQYSDFTIKSGY